MSVYTGEMSATLSAVGTMSATVYGVGNLSAKLSVGGSIPMYTGTYEVTPSSEEQILYTNDLMLSDNITINPIPSNYGLITWNGATLTVS